MNMIPTAVNQLRTSIDCMWQDRTDFRAIRQAIERYRTSNDPYYLDFIIKSCNTADNEITKLLTELTAGKEQ